jgi:hypothetical protein
MVARNVRCLGLIALLGALGACAVTGQPVLVLFDDGGTRVVELATAGDLRIGDHVLFENNRIQRL